MKSARLAAAGCVVILVAGCSLPGSRPASTLRHVQSRPTAAPVAAQFLVDGSPVSGPVKLTPRSRVAVAFAAQVPPGAVAVMVDGKLVPAEALAWSSDLMSVKVPMAGVAPGHQFQVTVGAPAPIATPAPLQATMQVTVPANSTTGVQPGFQAHTPILVVVENSGPARPQSGLQDADMVYEYLSEYSVTRMTAIYFAHVAAQVGPMRSCRMINSYLGYAYDALTLCSGVSDGTGGWLVGTTPGSQPIANLMESTDRGGHFFRVGFKAAPHNLYTSGDRAEPLRTTQSVPGADYAVDPPHDDVVVGQPADAPQVPLHGVSYAYDGGSRQYLRFNDGAPFGDQVTGQQVHVKNVVLMHVDFHDAGWVEDENGGAHSVWYHMLGSGPAEVYSDGQVVHATWHMGTAGQSYFDNKTPVWFTDEAGNVLLLNTGLTWIHVLGNGQERCPRSPSDCG